MEVSTIEEARPSTIISEQAHRTLKQNLDLAPMIRASSNPSLIRIRGLPLDKIAAEGLVRDAIREHSKVAPNFEVLIVPSCQWINESCALIDFEDIPDFLCSLKGNPLGSWQVAYRGLDLSFDKHFIGFTQLYEPVQPIEADIIAICGIDGHAYGSWQSKDSLRRMWLRHFITKDLPSCRVFIYGYNGKLEARSVATIDDYALELMEALNMLRKTIAPERPIIFITHSFGGIILARAIIKAKQTGSQPALSTLCGILFFAVPHQGIDVEDMSRIMGASDHPRADLIRNIGIDSVLLKRQLADFVDTIKNTKIVSFYETQQSQRLEIDDNGYWKRTGEHYTSLQTKNAVLHLPSHMETQIPLHEDHSNIVKFKNRFDTGYQAAIHHIKIMIIAQQEPSTIDSPSIAIPPLTQSKTPKAHYMIPMIRNRRFVGRTTKLQELADWYQDDEYDRLAILGLGGTGKTQLALAFCHKLKLEHLDLSIFWTSALSKSRFEEDFSGIAKLFPALVNSNKDKVLRNVKRFLSSDESKKWLLVVDNADDTQLFNTKENNISQYLPQSEFGKILFTTRQREAVADIVDRNYLNLEAMSLDEAQTLLEQSLAGSQEKFDETKGRELVLELTCLPLAIAQASSFIVENRISISEYLALMQTTEEEMTNLLTRDFSDNTRNGESDDALARIWLLAFEQIRVIDPEAAEILYFVAYIENKAIPLSLLPTRGPNGNIIDAIGTLLGYSFLIDRGDGQSYDMHRSVHRAIKVWLSTDNTFKHGQNAIEHVSSLLPDRFEVIQDYLWTEYAPHLVRLLENTRRESSEQRAYICANLAAWFSWQGRNFETILWCSECLVWRDQWLLKEDKRIFDTWWMLADAYIRTRQTEKGIEILEHVIKITSSMKMPNIAIFLRTKTTLARAYRRNGLIEAAIELLEETLSVELKLGRNEKELVEVMSELARAYLYNRQPNQALPLFQNAMRIGGSEAVFEVSGDLGSGLAQAYIHTGQLAKGIMLLEEMTSRYEHYLSENVPNRLIVEYALGKAYMDAGCIKMALPILEHVVHVEGMRSETDFRLLKRQGRLALAYSMDEQIDRSVELMQKVVEKGCRVLPPDSSELHRFEMELLDLRRLQAQHKLAENRL